jgi:GLPGLI family protein
MKNILMIIPAMFCMLTVIAQQGTVVYHETMKLEIHLEGEGAAMQDLLPKERKVTKLLHFTPDATLFVNQAQSDDQEVTEEMAGGGTMVLKMEEPDEKVYFDINNQKVIEQRDFMSRMFLIESIPDSLPWKLTGNRKQILDYPCLEAYYEKDSSKTVAWFTPSIPVPAGPGNFRGLPGLILEVNVNEGKRIITTSSITQADVKALMVKPKQGKKVTKEEFQAIVEEKTGEMNSEGGGVFMIKITQ